MIRSELIKRVAQDNPNLHLSDIELVVNTILKEIENSLANNRRVELRGFGTFEVRDRGKREGRNPKTGEIIDIEAKKSILFKAGKELKEAVNNNNG